MLALPNAAMREDEIEDAQLKEIEYIPDRKYQRVTPQEVGITLTHVEL